MISDWVLGIGVEGSEIRVWGFGIGVSGFGFRVSGVEMRRSPPLGAPAGSGTAVCIAILQSVRMFKAVCRGTVSIVDNLSAGRAEILPKIQ